MRVCVWNVTRPRGLIEIVAPLFDVNLPVVMGFNNYLRCAVPVIPRVDRVQRLWWKRSRRSPQEGIRRSADLISAGVTIPFEVPVPWRGSVTLSSGRSRFSSPYVLNSNGRTAPVAYDGVVEDDPRSATQEERCPHAPCNLSNRVVVNLPHPRRAMVTLHRVRLDS